MLKQSLLILAAAGLISIAVPFAGAQDTTVSQESMRAWHQNTARQFTLDIIQGDHFFVNSSGPTVCAAIRRHIGIWQSARTTVMPPGRPRVTGATELG